VSVQPPPAWINAAIERRMGRQYNVAAFAGALGWALRGVRDYRVTSWYRTPQHNLAVGGSSRSQHLLGMAADFVFPSAYAAQAISALRAQGFTVIDEGDHIHVQAWPAGQLDAVFRDAGFL